MIINYSPNFNLKKRDKNKIKYLIYHYTGMKNDKSAIKKLTSLNSNVSCHYYITSSGKLIQMVPDLYIAWHAGKSNWKNRRSLNRNSIGICYCGGVESDGKTPKDTRTEEQKQGLLHVLKTLKAMYPAATIYSHNEFANKACPSFDATNEYKDL